MSETPLFPPDHLYSDEELLKVKEKQYASLQALVALAESLRRVAEAVKGTTSEVDVYKGMPDLVRNTKTLRQAMAQEWRAIELLRAAVAGLNPTAGAPETAVELVDDPPKVESPELSPEVRVVKLDPPSPDDDISKFGYGGFGFGDFT